MEEQGRGSAVRARIEAAGRATLVLAAAYLAMIWLTTQVPSVRAASPWRDDPYDAVASIVPQVVLVIAALVALRLFHYRRRAAIPGPVLSYQVRSVTIIAGLVGLTVAVDMVAWWRQPDVHGQGGWVPGASLLIVAAILSIVAVPIGRALSLRRRLPGDTKEVAPDALREAADELSSALSGLSRLLPTIGGLLSCNWTRLRRRSSRLRFLNLRSHPWRIAAALGVAAGTTLSIMHDTEEGLPDVSTLLLLWGFFVAIETVAVIVAFALFGRFLGIARGPYEQQVGHGL